MDTFLKYVVSLIVIEDPVFAAIMLASLVDESEIPKAAKRASIAVGVGFLLTILTGKSLLSFLGISIFSIKIFGGLVLLQMAFQMLQAKVPRVKHTHEEAEAAMTKEDIAVIPLAIPIMFGPGTFTTTLIFREENHSLFGLTVLSIAAICVVGITYILLYNALIIREKLKATGMNVVIRIFGLLTGALGSQSIVDGVKHLWMS